ncbi:Rrf2 family transcriptional regulator [Vibrio natriegens]|uniref:Rrf2 family transcriptional regulator n=2 Tax=Vibrio natriegens TaxID=691 RepID=A0AAN0Y7L7_VIBNA|nr:Rrf2 family transcriptional regulator [Vibrio natriegens]ANQ15507.1 Rrf2 family transcriptional regulator [Vibrio natriegens NBRC 15636 = ATCC 14048 = DSM 759]EPM41475.1 transcriptional regulator [Vibrio natriegens NBRC 15636 = ATCC 14048 = DSM 759]MDX6029129.1 Rrf2 family transcriptional regulator [Vibrio natriegens NBRC 15636 = ATCC 14048 = DSM 759]UUI14164.1 Rrf2 family transcriptional regulator [Vibrio natriegens]WRS51029.1 Rrf2 family transcriptional regulator [Vibrio natriegens NBRC 1
MNLDSRLSRVLHILLHLAHENKPMSSQHFATMLGTQSAVIRRTMAGLNKAGYITSTKGKNGGWSISCDLEKVTLLDIYQAIGEPKVFSIGFDNQNPNCLVEKSVNTSLNEALQEAEALLLKRLSQVTLASLSDEFTRQYTEHAEATHQNE